MVRMRGHYQNQDWKCRVAPATFDDVGLGHSRWSGPGYGEVCVTAASGASLVVAVGVAAGDGTGATTVHWAVTAVPHGAGPMLPDPVKQRSPSPELCGQPLIELG